MSAPRTDRIPYGGDYNPEQWPEPVWDEDHRLFTRAGIDTLTVGVFAWSLTQPAEHTYDFTVLDRILDRAAAEGRRVCLATGTAAVPPGWPPRTPRSTAPTSRAAGTATASATTSAPAHRRTAGSPPPSRAASRNATPGTRRCSPGTSTAGATRSRSTRGAWPCCGFSGSGGRARPAHRTCGRSSC